jgi:hypothetical protein
MVPFVKILVRYIVLLLRTECTSAKFAQDLVYGESFSGRCNIVYRNVRAHFSRHFS